MNEIIRKIVPVSSLPEELREGFDPNMPVEIVGSSHAQSVPPSLTEIIDGVRHHRRSSTDAVERVRFSRAEWDGRDALHRQIRRPS